eukprot:1532619-Lingulodinium_polyedra.AAC.1
MQDFSEAVEGIRVFERSGRRLQLAGNGRPWDHWPVILTARYALSAECRKARVDRQYHPEALS